MNTRVSLGGDPASDQKTCVYCGKPASTRDHTPPRCLLRRPLPSNLITLPACERCNSGFSFEENVVRCLLAHVSPHPELRLEREPGGRVHEALIRDTKLRALLDQSLAAGNGNYALTPEVFSCFQRVMFKTVQGLFFGLYDRVVRVDELKLDVVDNRRSVTPEQIAERYRPSPLEEIGNKPLSDITPSSWHSRQPIMIMELGSPAGGPPIRKVFRLKRETKIEWLGLQSGVFTFGFVKSDGGQTACVMDLWETLVVAVTAPWPDDRGPFRRGRKNPFSRERKRGSGPM